MPVNPNVLDPNKWVKPREKEKKQEPWLSRVTITTDSGKQYDLDNQELNWIKNRYAQDNADSYGYDAADQAAKAAGQVSAKVRATYTKSAVDQQLAQMGLPSQKNIDKYVGQFQQWNTGGIGKVFGNSLSSHDWSSIGNLYKQSWKYTDSAEDQMRKQKGLMPSALEANYTDTEVDDQLKAGGLPSVKDFNTYLGQYNNQRGIDALYANAAASYTAMRTRQDANTNEYVKNDDKNYTLVVDPATGRTETKTGRDWYAQAFYDELGRTDKDGNLVYGDIMPLLKPSKTGEEGYIDPTKSYIEQMDDLYKAKAKEDKVEFDGHSAFSYDDFAKHYPEYYDAYIKDMPWSDNQTIGARLGVIEREADAQADKDFYNITDKWFDDDKGIVEFVERYQKDYPPPTPGKYSETDYKSYYETMFSNMFAHGVSKDIVRKAMKEVRKGFQYDSTNERYDAITDAYASVSKAENKKAREEEQAKLWDYVNYDPNDPASVSAVSGKPVKEEESELSVNDWEKLAKDYIKQAKDEDENDEDTIELARKAVENALAGFFDPDEGIGYTGTVDDVIKVINEIEAQNWNNPAAMRKALEDYGFSKYASYSGLAADLTQNWSDDDKVDLALSLGDTKLIENADKSGEFDKGYKDIFGNAAVTGNENVHPYTKLDSADFNYALDWAKEQIADGKISEGKAYNILAGLGFQDELEHYIPNQWHRAHYRDVIVQKMFEESGGDVRAMWDGMTEEERAATAQKMVDELSDEQMAEIFSNPTWWKSNPTVYRTFGQAFEQQLAGMVPTFASGMIADAAVIADAIGAGITGRPAMKDSTNKLLEAQRFAQNYGSVYDGANGAEVSSFVTDAANEVMKMMLYGTIGGGVGSAISGKVGGTAVGSALSKALSSTKALKWVPRFFSAMVNSTPFMASSFAGHYAEAKQMGATNAEAAKYGAVMGIGEGALEGANFDYLWGRALGANKFGEMLTKGAQLFKGSDVITAARIVNMAASFAGEASEEGLGYLGETLWKMNSRWGRDSTEFSANDMLKEALMGGAIGLLGSAMNIGEINRHSILVDYWANHTSLPSDIVDVATGEKVFKGGTADERAAWENGDTHIMSAGEFAENLYQLDVLNKTEDAKKAQEEHKKRVDEANKKYNAVKAIETNLRADASALDPSDPEYASKLADLNSKIRKAAQDSHDASLVREDEITKSENAMDARVEAESRQREAINKAMRDHWAGIYLQNEAEVASRDYDAIRKNWARDRQDGATVTPESRAQAAEQRAKSAQSVDVAQGNGYNNTITEEANANGRQGTEAGAGNEGAQAGGNAGVSGQAVAVGNQGGQESGVLGRENPRWIESVPITEKTRAKGIDPVELRTDNHDASSFYSAIGEAKTANPFGAFVTQHEVDEYSGMRTYLSADDGVGVAVTSDGDIVSVFKNPDKNQSKKASTSILFTALENGGKKLDNFNSADLSDIYLQHGFVPVARIKFNDDYKPDGWNYERDGRPDILFWVHNGDDANTILDKMGTYEMPDVESLPLFEGENAYDDAKAYRDSLVNENTGWANQASEAEQAEQVPTRKLTDEEVARVQQAAKDIKFRGNVSFIDDPNEAEAWIDENGNVTINRTNITEAEAKELADNPAWWFLKHELAHFTEGTAEYEEYSGIVKRIMQRRFGDNYMTVLNEIKNDYAQRGKTLDDPGAERELVAKFMQSGELLNNAESIETLVREQGNLADRIYNWIRYKIQDLKLRRKPNSALARDLLKAERLYAQAYRKANRKASLNRNSETQYSVGRTLDSIAKAVDNDYMPLAEKYDAGVATEEETDRLRNIVAFAASQAGYEREAYHGTRSAPFTVFDRSLSGQNYGGYNAAGGGFDFTDTEGWARRWGAKANGNGAVRTVHAYLNTGKPFYSYDGAVDPSLAKYLPYTMTETEKENAMKSGAAFHKALEDNGVDFYDVMMREGYGSYSMYNGADNVSVYNPSQIKSADLVTYDDDGNIIPLSDRFRTDRTGDDAWKNSDIRYSTGQSWDELIQKYGAQPQGRAPRASDERVPNQVNDATKVSRFGRSLYESPHMTDDMRAEARNMMVSQNWLSYTPTTNEESMAEARNFIAARQPLEAQADFHDMVMQGKFGKKTNAIGLQLLADASERGDVDSFYEIATDLQIAATEAGQSAQIFNVLKELKGVGSAYYMQRVVDRLNGKYDDLIQKGKMNRIVVSPELMNKLSQARTVDQIAEAEEAVAKEIAAQIPLTWADRLSNWRYFSMLGNPVTHARNMFGNLLMKGMNAAKDTVATGIESAAERAGWIDAEDRAHSILSSADKATWSAFADASYNEQARNLSGGGKLGFETFVKQNMRKFDTKWVDALARFNFKLLEGEDIMFIRPAYKNALMQYMKAQGFTLNEKGQAGKADAKGVFHEMTNAQQTAAVEWASQQAWKQTFRDASSLATMLNKLSKEGPVAKLLVEGVMPFKKTPINIAKRGLEYSPAGIIMGTVQLATKVKQGKMSAATAIDNLSSGITGTALMALGVFLAKAGLIRAGGEDKKKYETYLEDTGDQTYSFKFGNVSINMSSIAPATIPLFMGVALQEMASRNDGDVDLSAITDIMAGTLNPFMEMSFMSSLNSALQNYSSNGIGGALGNTLLTAAENYGSQYLPTLGGKVAQLVDPTRRTTKSDATSPIGGNLDYYVRSLAKKVPGLEATLQPDVDIWGRTDTKDSLGEWLLDVANKLILPTNVRVSNRDAVDNELIRVVESTGVTDFLPSDGNKYFTVKGERYNMNARQYAQYSQERGQAAYVAIKELMASPAYQAASDETKADMLNKAKEAAYKQVSNLWKEKLGAFDK
jgi:hypothetical protein